MSQDIIKEVRTRRISNWVIMIHECKINWPKLANNDENIMGDVTQ